MPNALPTAAAYRHAHEAHQRVAGGQVVAVRTLVRETMTRIHNRDHFEFRGANEDSVYAAALDKKNCTPRAAIDAQMAAITHAPDTEIEALLEGRAENSAAISADSAVNSGETGQ